LGWGLRRREAAELEIAHLQRREDHWAIVDLVGKGRHIRTIDSWLVSAGVIEGRVFRCVCRAGKTWGRGVTERVVWHVVKDCAKRAAIENLAPHDLRRTCARLCLIAERRHRPTASRSMLPRVRIVWIRAPMFHGTRIVSPRSSAFTDAIGQAALGELRTS
jgi:integrase